MVSLSYGGCCVRGLRVIEVQRAREGKEPLRSGGDYGERGTTKTRSTPNRETRRQAARNKGWYVVRLRGVCLRTCGGGADAKIEARGEVRKETIAIATAAKVYNNSVVPNTSCCFYDVFKLKC